MNLYCTYFDSRFIAQGLALWSSIRQHDPGGELWVLALDTEAGEILRSLNLPALNVVELARLEADDPELARSKTTRSLVEYYFTLSPCWPRWLLANVSRPSRVVYIDADMFLFGSLDSVFRQMERLAASVMITPHRFPDFLRPYEKHGLFNVGILVFARDGVAQQCLNEWRGQCIEWCYDRVESDRYADQKYLERWPSRWGASLWVCEHPGVNLAPWNWLSHDISVHRDLGGTDVLVDGGPLLLFHFARFRPVAGRWLWQSGQLDYGVMGGAVRDAIYRPYLNALNVAQDLVRTVRGRFEIPTRPLRVNRAEFRETVLRLLFGSDWIYLAGRLFSTRLGAERFSGRLLMKVRKSFLRTKRSTVPASQSKV